MNTPRPNLAPTSPQARGDLHTGDLAPRPHPVGGEVSTGSPTATTTNTPPPRPRGDVNASHEGVFSALAIRHQQERDALAIELHQLQLQRDLIRRDSVLKQERPR